MDKFAISCHPGRYEAWPDVALTSGGTLVCVYSECTHHGDRSYTRIMLTDSSDRGRIWSSPRPLTEGTQGRSYYYNCPRITALRDGRLAVAVDRVNAASGEQGTELAENLLYFSGDDGRRWSAPMVTPLRGIVPDKLLELPGGRWILSAHVVHDGAMIQTLRYSDTAGRDWSDPVVVGRRPGHRLCEASILPVGNGVLVAFMRENSGLGRDCQKAVSRDRGASWGEVTDFPLPGCHRPVAGRLQDGRILVTYRFMQGGKGWLGWWTQNFNGAFTDVDSALASERKEARVRIFPIDYDRSPHADLGYSGWVQFPDGEIYVVNYIVDDAWDKAQIRGYAFRPEEFVLQAPASPRPASVEALQRRASPGHPVLEGV